MSAALAISPDQVRAVQTARRRAGLDEPSYRAALAGFGVASTKELTAAQAGAFLDRLNGPRTAVNGAEVQNRNARPASRRAAGPFAAKLQALWIAGWNLGVVRDRDDAAMTHFVERQTGIPHTRFLRDPKDAAAAIEAVKAMLVRDGGVAWPRRRGEASIELKRAIVAAQHRRLADLAVYPDLVPFDRLDPAELDALSRRLGAILRPALAAARSRP